MHERRPQRTRRLGLRPRWRILALPLLAATLYLVGGLWAHAADPVRFQWVVADPLPIAFYQTDGTYALATVTYSSSYTRSVRLTVTLPGDLADPYTYALLATPTMQRLQVRVALRPGAFQKLRAERKAPLSLTLTDDTGATLESEHTMVDILPNDTMLWSDRYGRSLEQYLAAWVTPNDGAITHLLHDAANPQFRTFDGGRMVGYNGGNASDDDVTNQVDAIFMAMSQTEGVKYVDTAHQVVFASGSAQQVAKLTQHVSWPSAVLSSKSGLCLETVVTMASAVEALGMQPWIVLGPNHAVLGVQLPHSGQRIYWETALTGTSATGRDARSQGQELVATWQAQGKADFVSIADVRSRYGYQPVAP